MAIGFDRVVALLRKILATDPDDREAGAENASDWATAFDAHEASSVVSILAIMAHVEPVERVREAQLHAILEIHNSSRMGETELYPLRQLKRNALNAEQLGYLAELGIDLA